jgi:spore coat protein CotH
MRFRKGLLVVTMLMFFLQIKAQRIFPDKGVVFNDAIVPRIDIMINKDSLDDLLSPANVELDHEYMADFIWNDGINKDTLKQVGFRLRGNTSRISAKKSFKIKFTYFGNKKFHGLTDLNLNGEHNDPSIIRSKVNWDLMQLAGLEGPRANHVQLYINGEYRGLYINVENIDDVYFKRRKKDANGQLFKCYYGSDFQYLGNNPDKYNNNIYEAANNEDNPDVWKIIDFTEVLNKPTDPMFKCKLESMFDVDDYLKRMAFEVLIGHWDNLVYNINNAYLYFNPMTKKMEILSYDLDNTYGIDWFKEDWSKRNIYSWAQANRPRPLYNNLIAVPEYKKRYGYYMKEMLTTFFNPVFMNDYLDKIKNKIAPYVVNDLYASYDYGFQYQDFIASYDKALGGHVPIGLKEYIKNRHTSALSQLQNLAIAPFINDNTLTWDNAKVTLNASATSITPATVKLSYRFDAGPWTEIVLEDNGVIPDTLANDGNYAVSIFKGNALLIDYFYTVLDASGQKNNWPTCDFFTSQINYNPTPKIFINEFMSDNTLIEDIAGEYEDWIELYNDENFPVYIGDKYITDNPSQPTKWKLPELDLDAKGYMVLWADEDQDQDYDHTNFKLAKSGEFIGLYDTEENAFAPIDTFHYGNQLTNKSYGRYPDGIGSVVLLPSITIGMTNLLPNAAKDESLMYMTIFPSVTSDKINVKVNSLVSTIEILDITGKIVAKPKVENDTSDMTIDVRYLANGSYTIKLKIDEKIAVGRFVKI